MEAILQLLMLMLELLVSVLLALFELTLLMGRMTAAPLKFLLSPRYRRPVQNDWRRDRGRCLTEFIGGTAVLLAFGGLLYFWFVIVTQEG